MKENIYIYMARWTLIKQDIRERYIYPFIVRAREAWIILCYARHNGFPKGDEEYARILEEAGAR